MKITYKEIADAAGVSLSKVEGDRRVGKFDKADLRSIAVYIANAVRGQPEAAPKESGLRALPGFDWEE